MSEKEWEAIQETLFFLTDENKMERLTAAGNDLKNGSVEHFHSAADLRARVANA